MFKKLVHIFTLKTTILFSSSKILPRVALKVKCTFNIFVSETSHIIFVDPLCTDMDLLTYDIMSIRSVVERQVPTGFRRQSDNCLTVIYKQATTCPPQICLTDQILNVFTHIPSCTRPTYMRTKTSTRVYRL